MRQEQTTSRSLYIVWIIIRSFITFSPLFLAGGVIYFFSNESSFLSNSRYISDNRYPLNNILLVFLAASYQVVGIGLIFYFAGIWQNRRAYQGVNRIIQGVDLVGILLILLLLFACFLYLVLFAISFYFKLFNLYSLILINKVLTIGIFAIFLITDILMWLSHHLQLKEQKTKDTEQSRYLEDQIKFSRNATFLINIPAFLLALFAFLLAQFVKATPVYKSIFDPEKHNIHIPNGLKQEIFELFLNGLEAGIIISTIVFSQIIFAVLKVISDFNRISANNNRLAPNKETEPPSAEDLVPAVNSRDGAPVENSGITLAPR